MGSNQKAELGFLYHSTPIPNRKGLWDCLDQRAPELRNFIEPVSTHWQFSPT